MQRLLTFLLFITPLFACAQDLTGVWQGHFSSGQGVHSSLFDIYNRYKFEVQIAQNDKKFEGVTYSYLSSIFYGKAAAAGTVNQKTGKVILQEGKLLEVRQQFGDIVCIMTCFLQYTKSGDEEFLEGKYVSMNVKDSSNCGHGTVFLRKVPTSDFYEEPFLVERKKELKREELAREKPEVKAPPIRRIAPPHADSTRLAGLTRKRAAKPPVSNRLLTAGRHPDSAVARHTPKPATHRPQTPAPTAPALARASIPQRSSTNPMADSGTGLSHKFPTITPRILLDRSNTLVRSLTVNTREVVLNIYDDGIIDNDTVSVYLDNKRVIDHAMLTDRPLVLTLHLDEDNDYHELVMVADNEGTIPPNTSLMIVKAGDKEYKVNISSSLLRNATVTFKYVKPN
ncbi:MAG TPA: hypothetical protein VMH27_12565 [Puia sp.]|nr:hypothetical protein [Puia sp.]